MAKLTPADQQRIAEFDAFVQRTQEQRRWMIDGRMLTKREFIAEVFPTDSPELTMFLLRYPE